MKRFATAGVSMVAVASMCGTAFAADIPQPVEPAPYVEPAAPSRFDWSGFYFGGQLGWQWSDFNTRSTPTGSFNSDADGVTGGVHAGYNYQVMPNVVLGGEVDFSLSDINRTRTLGGVSYRTRNHWNSTLRARAGWTFDRFMLYGTGGLALADISVSANGAKDDVAKVGWTAGAGVEGAITDNITARLEYLYQDYGRESFTLGGTQYRTDLSNNIVRFGASYKF